MKVKDIGKIKELGDLKQIDTNDVIELLDELRGVATKRGVELLGQGRHRARRALGAPEPGAVGGALVVGILLGAVAAAVLTLLATPWAGPEARRRISAEVEKRVPSGARQERQDGNGRAVYEREVTPSAETVAAGGSLTTPTA